MKTADVIAHYGSPARAAKALNCSRAAINQWGVYVPRSRQYELEIKTGGALTSDFTQHRSDGTPSVQLKEKMR